MLVCCFIGFLLYYIVLYYCGVLLCFYFIISYYTSVLFYCVMLLFSCMNYFIVLFDRIA